MPTTTQVRRKLKLTSADILTPEYHPKDIDLSKVGVKDLRVIYRKKKAALTKKAKEDAAKKEAADKKARQAEEAQKAKQAEEAQKARQAEEAKGPVKKKKTTAKGPAKKKVAKKKTERNAVSRYDALTDEQKNKLEEDTGLSRSKGELIEAILEDEARFNKLIDGIEAGEVTKKKVTKKKVAKKKTTAKKAKEEANIKAVKENDSQTNPNKITKNARS